MCVIILGPIVSWGTARVCWKHAASIAQLNLLSRSYRATGDITAMLLQIAVENATKMVDLKLFGKSKQGLINRVLNPKFLEKIGAKSFLENRAFSGLIEAFPLPIGAFSTTSSTLHSHGGRAEIAPKSPIFGPIGAFSGQAPVY